MWTGQPSQWVGERHGRDSSVPRDPRNHAWVFLFCVCRCVLGRMPQPALLVFRTFHLQVRYRENCNYDIIQHGLSTSESYLASSNSYGTLHCYFSFTKKNFFLFYFILFPFRNSSEPAMWTSDERQLKSPVQKQLFMFCFFLKKKNKNKHRTRISTSLRRLKRRSYPIDFNHHLRHLRGARQSRPAASRATRTTSGMTYVQSYFFNLILLFSSDRDLARPR